MGHMPVYGIAQTKLGDPAYAGMVCHPVWTTMHLYLLQGSKKQLSVVQTDV